MTEIKKDAPAPAPVKLAGEEKLTGELKTVAGANANAATLPKGEIKPPLPVDEPKKDGRGRPKKQVDEQPVDRGEKLHITPMINASIIPIAAKKLRKKKEDMQYNEEEIKLLNGLQPPIYTNESSWPVYVITACSILVMKFYTAETERIEKEIKDLQTQVKEFANNGATNSAKSRQSDNSSGAKGERENADNKKTGKK